MKTIYNSIREEVIKHSKVMNSVLGNVKEWKRSHYIILSEIMKEELSEAEGLKGKKKIEIGNTISHVTLQRFFENDYQDKTHSDLRFLKTLDKICIFLGYKDLNSYIQFIKGKRMEIKEQNEESFLRIIYNYCATAFEFYKQLPNHKMELFESLVFNNSPFLERTSQFSKELCDRNFQLVTKNNRSNFEVFDIRMVMDQPDKKILKSQEFWNLLFKVDDNVGEEYFVNQLNTQVYFIRKINNVWKIWDNYNPNAGKLDKKIEII